MQAAGAAAKRSPDLPGHQISMSWHGSTHSSVDAMLNGNQPHNGPIKLTE